MEQRKRGKFVLSEDAEKIYAQFGGIDKRAREMSRSGLAVGLIGALGEEEQLLDSWRLLLVESGRLLATLLNGHDGAGVKASFETDLRSFAALVKQLMHIPSKDRRLGIRFRGHGASADRQETMRSDYVIDYGFVIADLELIKAVSRRLGNSGSRFPAVLYQAFETFASLGISSLSIDLAPSDSGKMSQIRQALQLLAHYLGTVAGHKSVAGAAGPKGIMVNEFGQPDPNLTLLAGLNNLGAENIEGLVQKISGLMAQPNAGELSHYATVYDSIFAFKKLREQLIKPPVEVNTIRWLPASRDQDTWAAETARLTRLVMRMFGADPLQTARVLDSIYPGDFEEVDAAFLKERLDLLGDFLYLLERDGSGPAGVDEILRRIWEMWDLLPDEVLADLTVSGEELKARTKDGRIVSGKIHAKLLEIVTFFKQRLVTKGKLRRILHRDVHFDPVDVACIARDFGIDELAGDRLIAMLQECFDDEGRFRRRVFEKNVEPLARFGSKAFGFLWYYLKDITQREDRVAFLNALQLLIAQMGRPKECLRTLLDDFAAKPSAVSFSDRNALILANILLRKYNKELRNDVELTPEEVLLVKEGLDQDMVGGARELVSREQEKIYQKLKTIHKKLEAALNPAEQETGAMPVRYLVTLEREVFIFLSLVGGSTGHRIMQSALAEYGNPFSKIYVLASQTEHLKTILQLLQLVARGLGRFGDADDIFLLEGIGSRTRAFYALRPEQAHLELVDRVQSWIDNTLQSIRK